MTLVDLHPPGAFDPDGLHNVIWKELAQPPTTFDPDHPLAVVSYAAGEPIKAYIEPLAVGDALPQASLFLTPRQHVLLPLERSYRRAFQRLPRHLQCALE